MYSGILPEYTLVYNLNVRWYITLMYLEIYSNNWSVYLRESLQSYCVVLGPLFKYCFKKEHTADVLNVLFGLI